MRPSPKILDSSSSSPLYAIDILLALSPSSGQSGIRPHCSRYLLVALSNTFSAIEKADSKRLMKIHSLWNSMIRFLLTPRTDGEITDLLDGLSQCSCPMYDTETQNLHQHGAQIESNLATRTCTWDPNPGPSTVLVVQLFCIIEYAMGHSRVKSVATRTTDTWPSCPDDLMPFGPENVMQSLLQWTRFTKDAIVYRTAAHIYLFCGSLISASFLNSLAVKNVIDCARELFDRVYGALGDGSAARTRNLGTALTIQLKSLFFFLDKFNDGRMTMAVRAAALDGHELKSVEVFSMLAYLVTDCRLSIPSRLRVFEECCKHARLLYGVNHIAFYLFPDILVHPGIHHLVTTVSQAEHNCM